MLWGVYLGRFPRLDDMGTDVASWILVLLVRLPAAGDRGGEPKAGRNLRPSRDGAEAKAEDDDSVGNPLAPGLMALLKQEIRDGLQTRGNRGQLPAIRQLLWHEARQHGRRYTQLGSDGQLPAALVRPPAAQPAGRPRRGRTVHPRAAPGLRGDHEGLDRGAARSPARSWTSARAAASCASQGHVARAGPGGDQAGPDRGPGRLRRRLGPA